MPEYFDGEAIIDPGRVRDELASLVDPAAKAWAEGFLFAYFLERGWTAQEALKKARETLPEHQSDLIPWNPYA